MDIVKSSKPVSTNNKYDVYFKKFKEWCIENKCSYLPASVSSVAIYLSDLFQQSVSFSVFCAHFYSIKWYHDFNLLENPCDDKLLHMIAEGAKIILGKPIIKKEPISVVHLQEIVKKFGVDCLNLYNVRMCAMYYLFLLVFFVTANLPN